MTLRAERQHHRFINSVQSSYFKECRIVNPVTENEGMEMEASAFIFQSPLVESAHFVIAADNALVIKATINVMGTLSFSRETNCSIVNITNATNNVKIESINGIERPFITSWELSVCKCDLK